MTRNRRQAWLSNKDIRVECKMLLFISYPQRPRSGHHPQPVCLCMAHVIPLFFILFPRIIQCFQIKQTKGSSVSLSQDIRAALLLGLTHLLGDEMGSVPALRSSPFSRLGEFLFDVWNTKQQHRVTALPVLSPCSGLSHSLLQHMALQWLFCGTDHQNLLAFLILLEIFFF